MRGKGWRNDSYRHYLAAKGIKTSYYSKSPYSKVSVSDINMANEMILRVKAKNPKLMEAAEIVGSQEAELDESRKNLRFVRRKYSKLYNYILREDSKGRYVTREELIKYFGLSARTGIVNLEQEGFIERTTPEGHTWKVKE